MLSSTAEVVGISLDDVASHRSFCSDLKLSFPLLADTDGTVSTLYGSINSVNKSSPKRHACYRIAIL
eukprot:20540-Heterococcus_DN1.PRE.3